MPVCIVVPGLLSSELTTLKADKSDELLWIDHTRLALCGDRKMALEPDGETPLPPNGEQCYPRWMFGVQHDAIVNALRRELRGFHYRMELFAYDWRRKIDTLGEVLAARVTSLATAGDPCTIVAHSMGGLVARAAWAELVSRGRSNHVRRIITIATPHTGCYALMSYFSIGTPELREFLNWKVHAVGFTPAGIMGQMPTYDEIVQVFATWPSMYHLLPYPSPLNLQNEPFFEQIFQAQRYTGTFGISQTHLDSVLNSVMPQFINNPDYMPPPGVMICIGGTGQTTPHRLKKPPESGKRIEFFLTDEGDGVVAQNSSLFPEVERHLVVARHGSILKNDWVLANITRLVLKEDEPPPDPPMPEEVEDDVVRVDQNAQLPMPRETIQGYITRPPQLVRDLVDP